MMGAEQVDILSFHAAKVGGLAVCNSNLVHDRSQAGQDSN